MELVILPGILLLLLAFIAIAIWLSWHFRARRTDAMRSLADEMSMDFDNQLPGTVDRAIRDFGLFNRGRSRKVRNVMTTQTDASRLTVFDYHFVTGGGNHTRHHAFTVVAMVSADLRCPSFELYPETLWSKIGSAVGFQDIDFDSHPAFSSAYVLKGANEVALRDFFDHRRLDYFSAHRGLTVQVSDGVMVYSEKRVKIEHIRRAMAGAYQVFEALRTDGDPSDRDDAITAVT